jgi:hypothetical protein
LRAETLRVISRRFLISVVIIGALMASLQAAVPDSRECTPLAVISGRRGLKGPPSEYIIMISDYEEAVSLMKVITGGNPPMGVTRTSWAAKMTRPRVPIQSLSQTGGPGQGIALRTGFFALDWTLRFTRTTVTIDGNQYLRLSAAGNASLDVDVAQHQVVQVSYRAPVGVLWRGGVPGKLTVEAHTLS